MSFQTPLTISEVINDILFSPLIELESCLRIS